MKAALVVATLVVGAASFGVNPRRPVTTRTPTLLSGWIPEEDMTSSQLEVKRITDKWNEVRLMSKEDAAALEPEWKEAYDRFHEKYDKDMAYMLEISGKVQKLIEPPKVEKKSKGQKKRDKWAIVQAREAARAAAALL